MNIQLALDRLTIEQAIATAEKVRPDVDWIEVGTSLVKEFGMASVRALREAFPEKTLLADLKTFDNARYECEIAFAAGADVITVMGAAPLVTVKTCLEVASQAGKQVMIDLLNTTPEQVEALASLENAIFCLHVSKDQQEQSGQSQSAAQTVPSSLTGKNFKLALAGGITLDSLPALSKMNPHVVIIGSAITKAADPAQAARAIRDVATAVRSERGGNRNE